MSRLSLLARLAVLARAGVVACLMALCWLSLPAVAGAAPATGVSGEVTSAVTHKGVQDAQVCVTPTGGGTATCVEAGSEGEYKVELKEGGSYAVEFTGYVCNGSCELIYASQTQAISVAFGKVTEGIDAVLVELGKISGRVIAGGGPVEQVRVCASGPGVECASTNANGEYTIEDLQTGSYIVSFRASVPSSCKSLGCQRANYVTQYWRDQPTSEAASSIGVEAGKPVSGVNAELQPGGRISGTVTNASITPGAIAGLRVCAEPTATNKEGEAIGEGECAVTNAGGEYAIQTLASGGYEVEFTGEVCVESGGHVKCEHPYIAQNYQAIVSVTAPGTTSGIDGSLFERAPTKPTNTAAPALTGVPAVGKKLSCSRGAWANNPTGLSYRWLRDGVPISGQTADNYTVQKADDGDSVACEVTAFNAAGPTGAVSNALSIPRPVPGVAVVVKVSVRGAVVSVTVGCAGYGPCAGSLGILAAVTTGHGRHSRTHDVPVGSAGFSMGLGKSVTLHIHLSGQGARLLRRAGRRGLKAQIAGSGLQAHRTVLHGSFRRR